MATAAIISISVKPRLLHLLPEALRPVIECPILPHNSRWRSIIDAVESLKWSRKHTDSPGLPKESQQGGERRNRSQIARELRSRMAY